METKTYKVPVIWESIKTYEVEATSLQEAVEKTLKQFLSEPDEQYIEDSFSIDDIVLDDYQDETYDTHKALNNI
jgi:hypothetical protein